MTFIMAQMSTWTRAITDQISVVKGQDHRGLPLICNKISQEFLGDLSSNLAQISIKKQGKQITVWWSKAKVTVT